MCKDPKNFIRRRRREATWLHELPSGGFLPPCWAVELGKQLGSSAASRVRWYMLAITACSTEVRQKGLSREAPHLHLLPPRQLVRPATEVDTEGVQLILEL
eukprot:764107-Hanusia_phi.AAC.3